MRAGLMTLALATAAGAFLAAGLIPLASIPIANADDGGINLAGLADPASFDPASIIIPAPDSGFISATDPLFALFGIDDIGLGTAGVTVNTFIDTMNPALDSSFTIPFEDPIAGLWEILVANDFFGL